VSCPVQFPDNHGLADPLVGPIRSPPSVAAATEGDRQKLGGTEHYCVERVAATARGVSRPFSRTTSILPLKYAPSSIAIVAATRSPTT
jgi:hypothetical protein